MSGLTRRSVLLAAALSPVAAQVPASAQAPSWPSGPIRIIVPFPPGGSVDAVARLAQAGLGQRLGVTVVVENRTGASGSTGTAAVAKAPPDGNTWLVVFDTHAVNPSLLPNLPFDSEKDLAPVSLIATAPYVVARHPSRPYRNLGELIRAAQEKPGSISYASVGTGSIGHLALELLSKEAGISLIHVPYRGGGPALNDAVAGHVDLIIASAALLMPQIGAGAIRPVFQLGSSRLRALPDVPTIAESGYPGARASSWWGFYAPGPTPKPIIERFRTALVESLQEERVAKQLTETQQMSLVLSGPEELRSFAAEQARIWGAVVRDNNIKADE
jgi:tripartite-type tricarboxylate transporter receptor subunit TctC